MWGEEGPELTGRENYIQVLHCQPHLYTANTQMGGQLFLTDASTRCEVRNMLRCGEQERLCSGLTGTSHWNQVLCSQTDTSNAHISLTGKVRQSMPGTQIPHCFFGEHSDCLLCSS